MVSHADISDDALRKQIKNRSVLFGGNGPQKIYGKLNCTRGKRMGRKNRVFFQSENEAIQQGFRPCAHCLRTAYKKWKDGLI